jgi:hypothetical protein
MSQQSKASKKAKRTIQSNPIEKRKKILAKKIE